MSQTVKGSYERGDYFCRGGKAGPGSGFSGKSHIVQKGDEKIAGANKRAFCPIHGVALRCHAKTDKARQERQARFSI